MTVLDNTIKSKLALNEEFQHLLSASIMIIDDEPINMEVVKAFLEEVGYSKFTLIDESSRALKVLEESLPDLLLLDLIMPEVSGFDILKELRAHPKLMHIPVIILTASTDTESKIRALDLGATDFLAKPVDQSELGLRVRNTLAAKAYQDQLAYYDSLTNLPNRHLFLKRLDWALQEADRHKDQLALLNIEIDHFDRINDTMGLSSGDEVLRIVARRIEKVIRNVDMLGRPEDTISSMSLFRMEGCVFSLLLDRMDSGENAALVAERIIQTIIEPIHVLDKDIYLTASVGIATYPAESEDSVSLMRLASSAKDYAKNKGGNKFEFYSSDISAIYTERIGLESKLRKALEKDELVLFYQPKLDATKGIIKGVEALVRWKSSDLGLVPPGDFIPLAEETGLIIPIGAWVINEACAQLSQWIQAGKDPVGMAINLSVKQFEDQEFVSILTKAVKSNNIDPNYIMLELTESLLMDNVEKKIEFLNEIKALGFKLSIDDFGTGYSSLNYLRRLPLDELKIDRSFIVDLPENADSRAIASLIINIAHSLGLLTIAEGVEKRDQLRYLQQEGCNMYQGFLFSKPIPGDELMKLLAPQE